MLTHCPFRSWCPHCVAGKAKEDPHRRQPVEDALSIPKFCADYLFLGSAMDNERAHPVLNCLDAKSGATFSAKVPNGDRG